ncbi:MAG: ABC transporter substrate-binding protein [Ectothiorhodospiraceae bacterium]|nr:ABC transporter substrate-binding protein [Ectothiorhodospiraceae bacterium]
MQLRMPIIAMLAIVLGWGAAAWADEPPAQTLVRDTTDKVVSALKRERDAIEADPERLYTLVDEIVLPHFDFVRMSQRVLGKYWRDASDEQQQRFAREFQALLVRTYATALQEYRDQTIRFLPSRERPGGDEVSVRTEVEQPGGPPIPISYEMTRVGEAWKVFDVAIDGVSLVINYRSTFANEIRQKGIDGLIERLQAHNREKRGA